MSGSQSPETRAERRERQEKLGAIVWAQHLETERVRDERTARLRAMRLARDAQAAKSS
jgi:hypothetical protein